MFLKPFIVHSLNVGDSVYGAAIAVLLVVFAKIIIPVDFVEDLHELLFGVWDIPQQFVIEMQDTTVFDGDGNTITVPALSKSYITKIKALMTQLCDHAMENNIIDRNYATLVKLPKMEAGKRRAFTDLEFAKLEKGWENAPGGDACLVLCYTGFRVSEFCELTKFSYDPVAKTLTGGMKTEAGKDRVVPVHSKILPIIERWYRASKGPLYPRPNGKAYNKDTFARGVWTPCMKSLGLPDDLKPHSARHTFGTRMSAAGARPEDIQRILGHADYSMTANTYINQDTATLKSAVELLA